jgi:DNA-binding Xre family transcriptional regulator
MTEKIKIVMIKKKITQTELANRLEVSQPTLSKKFKLDDWRESDLRKIADVCGCQYEGSFILNNGRI